uniref:RNA helicase n=1 Tax=Macrostomum lignano TaxID=282301 RepID=A0A1I8FG00_9PLAT
CGAAGCSNFNAVFDCLSRLLLGRSPAGRRLVGRQIAAPSLGLLPATAAAGISGGSVSTDDTRKIAGTVQRRRRPRQASSTCWEAEDDANDGIGESRRKAKSTGRGGRSTPAVVEDAALSAERAESALGHRQPEPEAAEVRWLPVAGPCTKGIVRKGYRVPTPIQRKTMPHILAGRMSSPWRAPALARPPPSWCRCWSACGLTSATAPELWCSAPTRELALQTLDFCRALGRFTDLTVALVLGGDSMERQFSALHSNPDIVVACPGRLLHLLTEMDAKLSKVEILVLDECDRLFELGFQEQLQLLLSRLPTPAPDAASVAEFARAGLSDPLLVRLDLDAKLSDQLTASFLLCRDEDKLPVLLHLLHTALKGQELTIVFVATKHHVEWLYQVLSQDASISVTYLYSSLDPAARRIHAANFRCGERHVLVTTDLAARGLDLPRASTTSEKLFVHRVGRVARAGRPGRAVSLLAPDELAYLFDLELFLGARRLRYLRAAPGERRFSRTNPATWSGCVPAAAVEEFADWCRHRHDISADLRQLDCAKRAMEHYVRSRPGASRQAVAKCKEARRTGQLDLQPHPMFAELTSAKDDVLKQIRAYRARATVFETKNAPAAVAEVMQKFRQKNRRVIEKAKTQKRPAGWLDAALRRRQTGGGGGGDIKASGAGGFFMPYTRDEATAATERGLAQDLQRHSMDILADETDQMRRGGRAPGAGGRIWDRKRKKFVVSADSAAGGGPSAAKRLMVRTESGQLVPASYKTDRYAKWRKRNPDIGGGDAEALEAAARTALTMTAPAATEKVGEAAVAVAACASWVCSVSGTVLQRPRRQQQRTPGGRPGKKGGQQQSERKSVEQIVKARITRERNKLTNRKGGKRKGGGGRGR